MTTLNQEQLRRLAQLGAVARLAQLREEMAAICAEFPNLDSRGRRARHAAADGARSASAKAKRRSVMSADARKAASERMLKYWAERRKAS